MKRIVVFALVLNAALLGVIAHQLVAIAGGGPVATQNGDTNGDGVRDITDAIYLLSWLFTGGGEPVFIDCPEDLNDRVAELEAQLTASSAEIEILRAQLGEGLLGCDLSDLDLSDFDLSRRDLGGANLRGANLEGANLDGADLHGALLSGVNLRNASLVGANLVGAELFHTYLAGADLRGADLRGAGLWETVLDGADLRGATGINLELTLGTPAHMPDDPLDE